MSFPVKKWKLSETACLMCLSIWGLFAGLLVIGVGVYVFMPSFEQAGPYALGLTGGCLLSTGKVILMEMGLDHTLNMGKGLASGLAILQTVLRYLLTAGMLAMALLFPSIFGPIGCVLGILTLQGAAHITGYLIRRK